MERLEWYYNTFGDASRHMLTVFTYWNPAICPLLEMTDRHFKGRSYYVSDILTFVRESRAKAVIMMILAYLILLKRVVRKDPMPQTSDVKSNTKRGRDDDPPERAHRKRTARKTRV